MQVDVGARECLQRCESAFGSLDVSALALPYTPMCCRAFGNQCTLAVSTSLGSGSSDNAAACAAGAALDLDRNGCVNQLDRVCAEQFAGNLSTFDAAPICFRDVVRPSGCCSDHVDAQVEFRVLALDATFRVVTAPGADLVNGCFANASQVLVNGPSAGLAGYDCAFKTAVPLADSPTRGDDCARSVALRFDATRLPSGTPMCVSQSGSACTLHTAQRAVKTGGWTANGAFTVAQLDVTGDACVGVADLRCRLAANELARRGSAAASSPRLPTCTLAARLALSQCLIAPPPLPYRDWRDRTSLLFTASRNKGQCWGDSVLTTEAALNPGRPLFVCTGPIAALWVNVDENACAARCSSAVNAAWPIDAILCCESRARECRVRLGVGKGAADINTVARDGITGAQVAQWPRSGAVECATLSAFALTGIALTYPRYVANTTIGNTSYANEDTYAGGPFPRAAAVELLGETAMASAEARCLTSVSPRCCRPNYGARGAPSQFGYELLVDSVVLPSNATCLPPTIYWQDNWGTNFACAPDAVVLATPTLGGPECLNFCRQHQTDAPFLELCCSIRATSDCMLAVGGRIPVSLSLGSYAFVGITTRYLDVTGDNCVNNEDLLCAAQTATMPSRVPLCPSTNFDRVMAECCRDEGMRSPAHVWAAFNGSTPSTRCATNGCVAFANENRLCRYASSPLAVWNATNSGACLALCRAAQFGNGTLNASPQLCCQFTSSNGLCTLTLGDVDSGPGGVTPSSGDRATTCIAPSAQRAAYNESCVSLNSVPCLITHASWGVPTRPVCAPLPLPTACCAVADGTLAPGDIDGDGDVTPNDVAMVARGAYATLPAPLIAAGPQCAALRNDTALVCGAVVTNATCTGSVVDSINSTVHGDATCRAWCESRRPPPTMPLTRYCCQSRAPGGSACTLIAAVQLPVAMLVASASAVSVCVHRALMAAAPEVPRVPVLVPSTWNSMVALPSGVGTPGCLGNADLACAAGRLAKRNDAYNCAEPSSPTPGATLPPGVSDTGSTSSSSGGGISGTAAINASTDANALVTTTITATDALVGPLIGVGVGALVLGILIGLLACFLINRKRNAAAAPASAAVVNSGSDRPNPRRESMYATVPRKAGGTEMAYIDLPAEQEATTAREAESEDDKNDIYNKMPVEYTAFPNP